MQMTDPDLVARKITQRRNHLVRKSGGKADNFRSGTVARYGDETVPEPKALADRMCPVARIAIPEAVGENRDVAVNRDTRHSSKRVVASMPAHFNLIEAG